MDILMFFVKTEFIFLVVLGSLLCVLLILHSSLGSGKNLVVDVNKGQVKLSCPYNLKLMDLMVENNIFLPSACGGSGTCGMCKVMISSPSTPSLIDQSVISGELLKQGYRLSCQLAVKKDLEVFLPSSVMNVKKRQFKVVSNTKLTDLIYEIRLVPDDQEEMFDFTVGDYIQVEYQDRSGQHFVRGYSMANSSDDKDGILLNVRLALPPRPGLPYGVVSSFLTSRKEGDCVFITGPYGSFHISESDSPMIYVAGGVGLSGIYAHIKELLTVRHTQRQLSLWLGTRGMKDTYYLSSICDWVKNYPNFSFNLVLSNEKVDSSVQSKEFNLYEGFVHEALWKYKLKNEIKAFSYEYYFCGPSLMNKGVLGLLKDIGVPHKQIFFDDFG